MTAGIDLRIGDTTTFSKTVSESDVYLFAGITGDLSANHVNEAAMRATPYGRRIVHGVLVLGFASTAATLMVERSRHAAVSYGYDRLRFVRPVFIGDTVTAVYRIDGVDGAARRSHATVEVLNEADEVCLAASHTLAFLPPQGAA